MKPATAPGATGAPNEAQPTLRLANLMRLAHPYSVDLYVETTLRRAKIVLVRMMGGAGYWPYGLEALRALSRAGGPKLAVVPGDGRWDASLEAWSTVPVEDCRLLWQACLAGGPENLRRALALMAHLAGAGDRPGEVEPLPVAGFWRPGEGVVDRSAALAALGDRPVALLTFYRALVEGGATAPVDGLVAALAERGIAALPVFVPSLKDRAAEALLADVMAERPPAIVLNGTAFAVSRPGRPHDGTVLDRAGRPVLQVVFAGTSREAWAASARGLAPRDLVMNVVLPEVDGRILTRPVSFKEEQALDPLTDSRLRTYRPDGERIAFVAEQAARWARLAAKRPSERRIALVLSNYPDRDGRIGNGVGLDTPESAARIAAAMAAAGYTLPGFPKTGRALMDRLLAGRTNRKPGQAALPPPSWGRAGEGGDFEPSSPPVMPASVPASLIVRNAESEKTATSHGTAARGQPGVTIMDPGTEAGVTGACDGADAVETIRLPLSAYRAFHDALPEAARAALAARWGAPEDDPALEGGAFPLALHRFGAVVVGIQPARGYGIDPKRTYHDPDLVPPHAYLAFYAWLRMEFGADAVLHLGKHGNLEWLPGKALGLSAECWPEIALGATPLVYPFIVNDPGEGAQAKRRSSAVIVDHLMPAMTRAEAHGPFAALETLLDEHHLAAADPRRRRALERDLLDLAARHGIDRDLELGGAAEAERLRAIDAHLCELKELQIRDGLHILGAAPADGARIDTLVAIARVPRSGGRPEDASLHRALAADLGLAGFDPLACDLAEPWTGARPASLAALSDAMWRTAGDTVERLELLARRAVESALDDPRSLLPPPSWGRVGEGGDFEPSSPPVMPASVPASIIVRTGEREQTATPHEAPPHEQPGVTIIDPGTAAGVAADLDGKVAAVLHWIAVDLGPRLDRSGGDEIAAVLAALDGRFVPPGPSGAPTRGRADVLPTGRNFYSVDTRAVPTEAAWRIGRDSAEALALRYFQDEGEWPRSVAISAWGTANMRTGGDDIAQVLALVGAEPVWEPGTGRVTGFKVLPLAALKRPRIDVTLRVSGLFRDAFPEQIDLIDSAIRAVAARDEPDEANPLAAARRQEADLARVFGAEPGAYGAGLQALIDEGAWDRRADFADAFLAWGGYAYGGGREGEAARDRLAARLAVADAVIQNQDNREHDLLDSDDYYQFQGGLAATIETLKGRAPRVYLGDHSRPERPVIRPLAEEIGRVVRGRASNPKWIAGVMRHGYKGAFEIAATVDYLFAFAATTHAVGDHHFDALYEAYLADEAVRGFIGRENPAALAEIAARLREAVDRGLWSPRSNSAYDALVRLAGRAEETTP
ncbi:cobaltochelatase subunit CobN [Prosthecomicrobium pneumaticum]|uniref:Cobaltochelatase subunit CobN n=1 Tax=Prosthecomicrobium pneumaticum TaxID=81895 RepID=A0A7W9FPV5_9HYPH|nr:cobaltochelatase subunit CobN [Prosthecomicrobium pneumaticum]MBB5754571.1 cobaltochelatase CobN [Prosthecomicrobium pneumaticum]